MRSLAFLLLLAACADHGPDYPIVAQGGSPPSGAGSTPTVIVGRVCVVTDPRRLTTCVSTGAENLTVTLANEIATTAPNGAFVINAPAPSTTDAGVPRTITVTGVGIIPSSQVLSPNVLVPAIREDVFSQVLAANGITLTPGSGSIMASIIRGGKPVQGATVTSTPSPAFGPFFDGTTPTAWTLNGTGAEGVAFLPGFTPTSPVSMTFTDSSNNGETTVGGVQVIDGGLTFVEGVLP